MHFALEVGARNEHENYAEIGEDNRQGARLKITAAGNKTKTLLTF